MSAPRFLSPVLLVLATSLASGLGGCVSAQQDAAPAVGITAAPGLTPAQTTQGQIARGQIVDGDGACGAQVARLQRILEQDREMGHINASVYQRMAPGVAQAAAKCRAGDPNGALAQISALKRNNGYY